MIERSRSRLAVMTGLTMAALFASAVVGARAQVESPVPTVAGWHTPATGDSGGPAMSASGRFVVFESGVSNLVAGDTNGAIDVFVRDRVARTTSRVSGSSRFVEQPGSLPNSLAVSGNGRFVAFISSEHDVLVRDRVARKTTRVNVSSRGAPANEYSHSVAISATGRFVAFDSSASNLVGGDTNHAADVFVRDRLARTTTRASVSSGGVQGNGDSGFVEGLAISADGRYVAFGSSASNLVAGDTNGVADVFVRDRVAGTTTRVSVTNAGAQGRNLRERLGDGDGSMQPAISAHGRFVAFWSDASNLVGGDTNVVTDVFVRDRVARTTTRVSVSDRGEQGNDWSGGRYWSLGISADGRFVAFRSDASNLVAGDTNHRPDVFVRDRVRQTTSRVNVSSRGAQAKGYSYSAAISADGRFVAFDSEAPNLVAGDTSKCWEWRVRSYYCRDVFVHDRVTAMTTLVSVKRKGRP